MLQKTSLHKVTTRSDRTLQKKVWRMGLNVSNYLAVNKLSHFIFECHSIATAFSIVIPELQLVHGYYCGLEWTRPKSKVHVRITTCPHSWLVTPSGTILDPYPVGIGTVDAVLVITKGRYKSFGSGLYRRSDSVLQDFSMAETWEKALYLACMIMKADADPNKAIKLKW